MIPDRLHILRIQKDIMKIFNTPPIFQSLCRSIQAGHRSIVGILDQYASVFMLCFLHLV